MDAKTEIQNKYELGMGEKNDAISAFSVCSHLLLHNYYS